MLRIIFKFLHSNNNYQIISTHYVPTRLSFADFCRYLCLGIGPSPSLLWSKFLSYVNLKQFFLVIFYYKIKTYSAHNLHTKSLASQLA